MPRRISDREAHIVTEILREFGQFQSAKTMLSSHCEEVAQLILPTSRNTFFFMNYNTPGQKKTQQQVDSTGALALHRFCAIADSLVTPRNMFWHGLQGDDYVMKDRETRLWFENTTKLLFRQRYDAYANFAAQNYNNWQSLGAFGNSTMYIDKFDNRWFGGGMGLREVGARDAAEAREARGVAELCIDLGDRHVVAASLGEVDRGERGADQAERVLVEEEVRGHLRGGEGGLDHAGFRRGWAAPAQRARP